MPDLSREQRRCLTLRYQRLSYRLNHLRMLLPEIASIRQEMRTIEGKLGITDDTPESTRSYDIDFTD
jgi:hypothetical protein